MSVRDTTWAFALVILAAASPGSAIAAEPSAETSVSKEQRALMASAHEKMAACLRSDRSLEACRQEMHASCMGAFGGQGCPMMGGMQMHDRPMKRPPPAKPDAQQE